MLVPLLAQSNPRSFARHSIDGRLKDLLHRDANSPEGSRVVVDIHRDV
jgi:hypothetical protein